MIQLYNATEIDYESNGSTVLMPTVCTIREKAGSNYELSLTHPIDPQGRWQFIQPGAVIKAPVPAQMTESTLTGDTIDVWVIKASAPVRAKPSTPDKISYSAWVNPLNTGNYYSTGDRVSYNGSNYQCIASPRGLAAYYEPSDKKSTNYWQTIASYTGGGEILVTLQKDAEVYFLSEHNQYWLRVMTMKGVEGYIQKASARYDRTVKSEAAAPRAIKEQLFRILDISVNTRTHTVNATAEQVSYDARGAIVGESVLTNQAPGTALALIKNALVVPRDFTLATNLSEEVDGAYTNTHTHQNLISALLDPEGGFVSYYKAKLIRDNWDMFIYRNDKPDRGMRITYGVNLTGVTWNTSADNLITQVMPVAKDADGNDFYISDRYITSPLAETYPVSKMEVLSIDGRIGQDDGQGGVWTEETLSEYMTLEAQKRFDVDNVDKLSVQVKVDYVLLGDTEEYKPYRNLQQLSLYDSVLVSDPNIGLERTLQVSEYTWDAIRKRFISITLGDVFDYSYNTVAGYELANGTIQYSKLSPAAIARLKEG